MGDKTIYVIAKVFDQRGCLAYRCKTAREAGVFPVRWNLCGQRVSRS